VAEYNLSKAAKEDLIRIYKYGVYRFEEAQAELYFNRFFEYFDRIAQQTFSFEAEDYIKPGYRRCPCGVDSIYYRLQDNNVEIMAIIGRQNRPLP